MPSRPTLIRAAAVPALAAALALSGCSSIKSGTPSTAASSDTRAVKNGGTLTVALSAEPDKLDPTLARTLVGRTVFNAICEKLYDVDAKLDVVPQLAAALPEFSADGKTVTIKVRTGVKFADGTPLDAAAVKTSLDRHVTLAGSARKSELSSVAGVDVVESLPALVASSDHVVIAAPSTPTTRHLFDREVLAAMKPGAHLVNVARGALVDQDALRAALDEGRVAMASLDAVEPEPLPDGHWMYGHPRVRLSPHVSWHMPGAVDLLLERFIDNLRRWRAGEPLTGVVDREAEY